MTSLLLTLFNRRFRGFRVVHIAAFACLAGLVLSVYLTKAAAGRDAAAIAQTNRQILAEARKVRLLRAELAHLEQPERLEQLSTRYLALQPIPATRETVPDGLAEVVRRQRAVETAR